MTYITRRITVDVTAPAEAFNSHPMSESTADDLHGLFSQAESATLISSTRPDERTYTLHAGIKLANVPAALRAGWRFDGDGWNTWGEAPGTESNNRETMHGMWRDHVTLAQAEETVTTHRNLLAPMTPPARMEDLGCFAVVSDPHVWSEAQDKHWQ